jgi:transcriptional regulator with XRE-family HTH domain
MSKAAARHSRTTPPVNRDSAAYLVGSGSAKGATRLTAEILPDDNEASSAAENKVLGDRIRDLRKGRSLSLQALSERSGLSVALISQIERGVSSPSMRSLRQVASAFGLPVAGLFQELENVAADSDNHVLRHNQRKLLHVANTGISMELLTADEKLNLRSYHTYIAPGGSSGNDPDSHEGSETGIIMTGQMDLWLGDKKYSLNPGDSFSFNSLTPHRYSNPGNSMMHAFWVVAGLVFFPSASKPEPSSRRNKRR